MRSIRALRDELYGGTFGRASAGRTHRDSVAGADAYRPPQPSSGAGQPGHGLVQRVGVPAAREKALQEVFEHILYEDRVTSFIDIGPVNKILNAFVHHFQSPGGDNFRRAFAACDLYLWEGHDGVKMQGSGNSRLWDTAFATQAILATSGGATSGRATSSADAHAPMLEKAYGHLRENQILEDVPEAKRHSNIPPAAAGPSPIGPTAGRSPTAPPKGSSARWRSKADSRPRFPRNCCEIRSG